MAKIGRNEKCPCGSGRKYKHCCSRNPQVQERLATAEEQMKISLMSAVEDINQAAKDGKAILKELGVFVLFATSDGNGWLFEVTQSDCVQLVRDKEILHVPIDENPQTIEIEWSHTFEIVNKEVFLITYRDRITEKLVDCPVKELSASIRRIKKKVPPEMLKEIHIDSSGR
jgi:hypothetical protein